MAEVQETVLPGVGVRYDFQTRAGIRLGVLVHRGGRRDLLVYSAEDPDACVATAGLSAEDALVLSELLGGVHLAEHLVAMQQQVEGLAIDWLPVEAGSEWAGRTLAEAAVHTNTGVSVVALLRDSGAVAAPGAGDVLRPGDTAVAIGTAEGIAALARYLRVG